MSFADLFDDIHQDAVTVRQWTDQEPNGSPIFGDPVTLRCRVVRGAKMFRDERGQMVLSRAVLYAGADEIQVRAKDEVTLPGDSSPSPILGEPAIFPDENGDLVQTVRFG